MKKLRGKIGLTLIILFLTLNNAFAREFSDLGTDCWAGKEIGALARDGVVAGYPDGTYKPDRPVSKAEFVTMVIKALWQENYKNERVYYYKDVPEGHWAYEMIQKASDFELLKGYPDGYFKPDENLKRAEAVTIVISAVDAGEVTEPIARNYLSVYKDAGMIPAKDIIAAGKAQKYHLIANRPSAEKFFYPENLITRAEMAVMLFNMREQALLHPNRKLAEVFTPRTAVGIKIENVEMEQNGFIAVVPAGTIISGVLAEEAVNSQNVLLNQLCVVRTLDNYVTDKSYLLIPAGTNIAGEIVNIKKAKYFIRNAKMDIDAKRAITEEGRSSEFRAAMSWSEEKPGFFSKIFRAVFKGKKIVLNKGDVIFIELTEPVRIDTAKTMIINPRP